MLRDNHNRTISYLRISLTDRCNFRCAYCLPEKGVEFAANEKLLTLAEIERTARVAADLGVTKIRLTGGEPTLRGGLVDLVAALAAIPGIAEVAMTTNAAKLDKIARPLKIAGLKRLNISLDTLQPARFRALARRDSFEAVMRGIEAARGAGFTELKFNAVVMRGVNDDELCELVEFASEKEAQMRFIEYMPMGALAAENTRGVSMREMLARLNQKFAFEPGREVRAAAATAATEAANGDSARILVCQKTNVRVGFIASMSDHFCGSCNRMRLTATGGLRPCLHQNAEVDLRRILRECGTDEQIAHAFRRAANLKWAGHEMNAFVPLYSRKAMIAIGG